MGFLKTVLIILLVYYLLRIVARWLTPWMLKYVARKTEKHFRQTFEQAGMNGEFGNKGSKNYHNTKESNVSKESSKPVGEYIDFEEIE